MLGHDFGCDLGSDSIEGSESFDDWFAVRKMDAEEENLCIMSVLHSCWIAR